MTGATKKEGISAGFAVLRVLLLLVAALFLGQTRVWAFTAPPQPASGQTSLASPSSVGEITTAWHYDASDSLLAANRGGGVAEISSVIEGQIADRAARGHLRVQRQLNLGADDN